MKTKNKFIITLFAVLLCAVMVAFISACKDSDRNNDGENNAQNETTITSISVLGSSEAYIDEFAYSDYTIIVYYSDRTTCNRSLSADYLSESDQQKLKTIGNHTVTVTYEGKTTSLSICIKNHEFSDISFTSQTYTYDGNPKTIEVTGLPIGAQVAYKNNSKTEAGAYTATATITKAYYETLTLTATLTINKAVYDMSDVIFNDTTVVYDGVSHSIVATNLPAGVTVAYENNEQINVGEYIIVAKFMGDNTNYEAISNITAKLTILTDALIGISFENKNFVYDGQQKSLYISGDLAEGITVSYEGNSKATVGVYTVIAKFTAPAHYGTIPDLTATLTITKANYDMSGVVFSNSTVEYDGRNHSIYATNLPTGVTATYVGNNYITVGAYTVTAHFTGDIVNYYPIPYKTATLTISKSTYDMSSVVFTDLTIKYDGNAHSIEATGLPVGVSVSYENNNQTEASTYVVTAKFKGDNLNYELKMPLYTTVKHYMRENHVNGVYDSIFENGKLKTNKEIALMIEDSVDMICENDISDAYCERESFYRLNRHLDYKTMIAEIKSVKS